MNFNSAKNGYKILSAHERLSKTYATFFTIHGRKWRQIFEPIKTLDVFLAMKRKKNWHIFSIKVRAHSSSYNQFFQNWNPLI